MDVGRSCLINDSVVVIIAGLVDAVWLEQPEGVPCNNARHSHFQKIFLASEYTTVTYADALFLLFGTHVARGNPTEAAATSR